MKVAVPTRDNKIDDHFGHCDHYTIYTIENKQIISTETLPSPEGCGCKSGIAAVLQEMGVEVMLAGSMGDGAKNKLESHGIKVIRGCAGSIQVVIGGFLAGAIFDTGIGCAGHDGEHQCGSHGHDHDHECNHKK